MPTVCKHGENVRRCMVCAQDTIDTLRAELERVTRELTVQKAVNELAYRPHRLLVESRDNEVKRREAAESERDALRAALDWLRHWRTKDHESIDCTIQHALGEAETCTVCYPHGNPALAPTETGAVRPASEGQCIRPERSEVNAPAVGSHATSPEARGDGSGDRRDGGPDAPRGWCACDGCTTPYTCLVAGCHKALLGSPPPASAAKETT